MEEDVPLLPSRIDGRAFGHFDYTEAFQQGVGANRVKCPSRNHKWLQPQIEERINREMMAGLFSAVGVDSYDCVDKLIESQISYRDLGSLSVEDLKLIGFKHRKQCEELLATFKILPKQEPSYQSILERPESKKLSSEMFQNAIEHLEVMTVALRTTNRKMRLKPPENFLMGEKYYASHFVLKALDEMHNMTFHVEEELNVLEQVLNGKKISAKGLSKPSTFSFYVFLVSTFVAGTLTALWLWKMNK